MKIPMLLALYLSISVGLYANKIDDIKNIGSDIKNSLDQAKGLAQSALDAAEDEAKQVFAKMATEFKTLAGDAFNQLKTLGADLEKEEQTVFDGIKAESEKLLADIAPLLGPIEGLVKEGAGTFQSCEDVLKAGLKMPLIFVGNEVARAVLDAAESALANAQALVKLDKTGMQKIAIPFGDKLYDVETKLLDSYENAGFDIKTVAGSFTVSPLKLDIHAVVMFQGKEHTINIDPKALNTGQLGSTIVTGLLGKLSSVI